MTPALDTSLSCPGRNDLIDAGSDDGHTVSTGTEMLARGNFALCHTASHQGSNATQRDRVFTGREILVRQQLRAEETVDAICREA
jgi:hypothetical protein